VSLSGRNLLPDCVAGQAPQCRSANARAAYAGLGRGHEIEILVSRHAGGTALPPCRGVGRRLFDHVRDHFHLAERIEDVTCLPQRAAGEGLLAFVRRLEQIPRPDASSVLAAVTVQVVDCGSGLGQAASDLSSASSIGR
jgi:hypothetical protein